MTYIKENITADLQKLYSPTRNLRAGNESSSGFLKKPLCTGNLPPMPKIFIERPGSPYTEDNINKAPVTVSVLSQEI